MGIIKESFLLIGSNADILAAPSRLAAIPQPGILTIEASIEEAGAVNFGTITLQLPGGEIPFEDLLVPFNGFSATDAVMHIDTQLTFRIPVAQGGHVLYQYTEGGATSFLTIVTLEF